MVSALLSASGELRFGFLIFEPRSAERLPADRGQ
jgi:hypothetical protein